MRTWLVRAIVARVEPFGPDRGGTMAEWVLVVGLIAVAAILAVGEVGDAVTGRLAQFASLF